jgi:hypothetical protein
MAQICTADSLAESLAMFKIAEPLLKDCKFVFAATKGGMPGFAVNRNFSNGGVVRSLFNTENILVLDRHTVHEMESGDATYPIDYSISLDTQTVSYLEPYLNGRTSGIPADFKEAFEFIARDDVFVDPIPYLHENLHNLNDQESADKIFRKLKAYEVLRTLDTDWLSMHGEARSKLTELELAKKAQEHVAQMFMKLNDDVFLRALEFRQRFTYCHLLKMAIIQIGTPKISVRKKIELFVEFCDAELATLSGREIALARAYFAQGQDLTFFGKVQAKKADLFDILNGMAWDLWHVRQMEESMTLKPSRGARYFFPALLTFDKKFIEIMDLYPLKACAFIEGDHEPMPFYNGNWFSLVADNDEDQATFAERFYSVEARTSRDKRRVSIKDRLKEIVGSLEGELSNIASVTKFSVYSI